MKASSGFKRLWLACGYSCKGLAAGWRNEAAFRQEVVLCALCVPLALWLGETGLERAVLLFSVLLVPLVELINSAIEAAVDRVGEERHQLSAQAKDMGSAAVSLALIIAVLVWACILLSG